MLTPTDHPSCPPPAFGELYLTIAPALHAWACLRLIGADRARVAPEDLTQEVWLRAFQVFGKFDAARTTFRAWLFAVAKNVLLEVRRRLRDHRPELAAAGSTSRLSVLAEVPEEITSISRRLARNEDLQRFMARLQELEAIEQQTVLHCGLEGMPQAEAAARLGEPAATTAKRWQRLRERMRSWAMPLGLVAED